MICARMLLAAIVITACAGCATKSKPLYYWEGYQRQVYEYLKGDGSSSGEQLTAMQAQAEKARAAGATLPPGFRAHLGMLYLRMERYEEGRQMLEAEKAAFPESTQYMDFVLKSMGEKTS